MSSQFGFIDIILLAMFAGFIILRLRNILGRKTGHQGKPASRYFPRGIGTLKDIEKWILLGVNRVIIGTSAITESYLVKEAVKTFPNKVSVGLDLLDEFVAIRGWTEVVKEKKAEYFFKKFSDLGVETIIYTDINNDGVLKGPNFNNIVKFKIGENTCCKI